MKCHFRRPANRHSGRTRAAWRTGPPSRCLPRHPRAAKRWANRAHPMPRRAASSRAAFTTCRAAQQRRLSVASACTTQPLQQPRTLDVQRILMPRHLCEAAATRSQTTRHVGGSPELCSNFSRSNYRRICKERYSQNGFGEPRIHRASYSKQF